jgi:HEPN domain-containing protein
VLKDLCLPFVSIPIPHFGEIDSLTKHAWRFRYPGAPYAPDREEAEDGLRMASELLEAIASQLDDEFNRV